MKNKQDVIQLAQSYPYNSKATTFRGAYRAIRAHGIVSKVLPLPLDVERWPLATHLPSQEQWYANRRDNTRYGKDRWLSAITSASFGAKGEPHERWQVWCHQQRLAARMERLAAGYLAAGRYLTDRRRKPVALLDRQQYHDLAEQWIAALDLPARDQVASYACAKYRDLALACAKSYHARIADLYTSKYASIEYGQAEQQKEWDRYAKSYHYPCVYTNAGVTTTLDDSLTPRAVLHPVRGNDITLPLHPDANYHHLALLSGDLYARTRTIAGAQIVTRYDHRDRVTGIAVRLPIPEGIVVAHPSQEYPGTYWEHGPSVAACRAEWEAKRQRAEAQRLKAAITRRQERKARLIARLCAKLPVTYADARSVGYCAAGIGAFQARWQLGETATIAQLRATGDSRVTAIITAVARRVATATVTAAAN